MPALPCRQTASILPLQWQNWLIGAIAVLFFWLGLMPQAIAAPCRTIAGDRICIEQITRSAKNHWEYRLTLSRNGQRQTPAIYNCRDRHWQQAGQSQAFVEDGLGDWLCRTLAGRSLEGKRV
ncbi:hypothetical protein [Synechococcus elongatus]|uniref:hypothetical protein n=1 Tax=Synechococcus elongatus TaxID=32046 RepID=UPI000F7EA9FC|nr:hypothetical protein [Synechococcus elongatus]